MKQEIINALSSWSQFSEFYEKTFPTIISFLITISFIIIIIRFGLLFWHYINTGNVGDLEDDSGLLTIINNDISYLYPVIFLGTHPGSIFIDLVGLALVSMIIGFAWPFFIIIIVGILPIILLAVYLRKRIARKQEFIAKLEGTYDE